MIFDTIASRYAWCTPERFVRLTMRQVVGFLRIIDKKKVENLYFLMSSYAPFHGAKMPSLDEFMGVTSETDDVGFSAKDDAAMEAAALRNLKAMEEARRNGG